jgi:oxygen-independent coproporphyrinogen III oxidase
MAGIYIHIPFCKLACHYCDFHFSTNRDIQEALVYSLIKELSLRQNYLAGEPVKTLYFGGGTPSLLKESELNEIVDNIYRLFEIQDDAEVTMEVNPDDLTSDKLNEIKTAGVNRLSVGIQSFDDSILKFLNRPHNAEAALKAVQAAREIGFDNISIDLIYAIPGQSQSAWLANIAQAISLQPQHISAYSLTIEPKTVFGNWHAKGKLNAISDEHAAGQLELLVDTLESAGYEQYEVSNFSLRQYESKHNSSYWKDEVYLGIGPSAHSYNGVSRQYNVSNNNHYVKAISQAIIPSTTEVLTQEDRLNEYLLTRLRTRWGCDLDYIKNKFNYDLLATNSGYLRTLLENRLATVENNRLVLTKAGKLVADKISSDLFLVN